MAEVGHEQPLDILIPVPRLSISGGIERFTSSVASAMSAAGHKVTILAPKPDPSDVPEGVSLVSLRLRAPSSTLGTVANIATFRGRCRPALRRERRGRVVYYPLAATFEPGVVTAHSCHAAWLRDREAHTADTSTTLFDRFTLHAERTTFRKSEIAVTTVSERCAEDIVDCYGVDPAGIAVTPPAVDATTFSVPSAQSRQDARRRFGLTDDQIAVGVVANFSFVRKQVDALIEACARLDMTLLVAGEPDVSLGEYERLAATTGADVQFLGSMSDMPSFYSALDVFALPSINEAYGMAAHEAMAMGVPTLISDACGIGGSLEPQVDAVVVAVGDRESLVEGLAALASDTSGPSVGVAGASWAHRRSWHDVASALTAVIGRQSRR